MKKVAIAAIIMIPIIVYATSPYFTESTVNEALPEPTNSEMAVAPTYEGTFVGVGDGIHDAQGTAKIIALDDGSQILRLEEFTSTNGPDLYVYLSTDKKASDFVNLGELKANRGNQNYHVSDVDLERYNQVLIWCKAFGVLFGNAELTMT